MPRCAALPAAALALAVAPLPVVAQDPDPQAVWDRFVRDCGAVTQAPNPAEFAALELDGTGRAGHTVDGRFSTATLTYPAPTGGADAILIVTVNTFPGGRTVQCMLQLVDPDPALAALADIARAGADELIGGEVEAAGGPIAEVVTEEGGPATADFQAQVLRFASLGFPPDRILLVQLMPRITMLIYGEIQHME
jgi:hypothetical protein